MKTAVHGQTIWKISEGGIMKGMTVVVLLLLALFNACSDGDTPSLSGQGQVRMYLVDSPALFDAVNIVVTSVEVHQSGADSISGWTTVNTVMTTHDLLTLRNGASAILCDAVLDPGQYTQIRLVIGSGSNVVVAGISFPLEIPSGMQSGLKLNHQFTIEENTVYELTLDFDAEQSITLTGAGQYQLNPVIRVEANEISGTISGTILPLDARATIWTLIGSDTVMTVADTSTGYFKLMAIPEGTYSVTIEAETNTYRDTTLAGIAVTRGQETSLGTMVMSTLGKK